MDQLHYQVWLAVFGFTVVVDSCDMRMVEFGREARPREGTGRAVARPGCQLGNLTATCQR